MAENIKTGDEAQLEEAKKKKIMKETLLRTLLTSKARLRLANIRMVNPELADIAENYVIKIVSELDINRAISDEELKGILREIQQPKRDFKIRWI
ncbi:MAG: DNA-binding protein [Candidatus Methylarchaceae archaeon HK02M2]|nr:DNA-binding protein [Candidatus Methylarchaceae archaeon HK02M2]